jgi:ATP/maltotriose-dependent transcriptional regulator MalT
MRKEIGETGTAAESQVALAQVALEENRIGDAETLASAALEQFAKEKLAENEIDARTVLAEVALRSHKLNEARNQIEMAGKLAAKSSFPGVRYGQAIVKARVDGASGQTVEAMKILEATIAEATNAGRLGDALEARLALGEVEMKNGKEAEGRARLEDLEKEARAKGFGRIMREAGKSLDGK